MLVRALSAAVGLPVLLGIVWLGDPLFTMLGVVVALLALREFYRLAQGAGGQAFPLPGYALGAALVLGMAWRGADAVPPLLALAVAVSLVGAMVRWQEDRPDTGWLWTLGGLLYLPLLLGHFLWLRQLPLGREWVFLVLLGTFATDTAAYFTGHAVGRHRLAPRLSPGKTGEGAIGGLIAATASVALLSAAFGLPMSLSAAVLLGLLVGAITQIGDLAESYLKRVAQTKDAGEVIPGHGGLLDRLDSLVFGAPVVYYYAVWVVGAG